MTTDYDAVVVALRTRRKLLGLSQLAVAQRIGASHASVSQWEKGHHRPRLEVLYAWAEALGFSLHMGLRDNGTNGGVS